MQTLHLGKVDEISLVFRVQLHIRRSRSSLLRQRQHLLEITVAYFDLAELMHELIQVRVQEQ